MILDVEFEELNSEFEADFGEMYMISDADIVEANEKLDECVHGYVTGASYAENVEDAVGVIEDVGAAIAEKGVEMPDVPGGYGDVIRSEMTVSAKTYEQGLTEGEAVGREKCWNEYWDTTQQNGERTNYSYAFAYEEFKAEQFIPKYDITPGKAAGTFAYSTINTPIIMSEWEQKNGIRFDTSYCSDFNQTFRDSNVFQEINVLDVSGVNASVNTVTLSVLFFANQTVQKINRLICGKKTAFVSTTFNSCTALEYIGFEGVISSSGFDLRWSTLLNRDCIISLFNTLSTATTGLTVTLSKTAVANAFETAVGLADGASSEEWLALVASRSNWTISLG